MLPFIIGIVPGIILLFIVWRHDKVEREPIGLIIKLMIAGAVFSYPYIESLAFDFLDSFNLTNGWLYAFVLGFLIAGLFEEALKYFVFDLAIWKSEEFDHTFDAIVYSVAFSAGFALFETAMYIWGSTDMMQTAILRDLTAVPGHLFCAVYMGYYLGMAKQYEKRGNKSKRRKYKILGLIVPVLLHGFYDFCCFSPSVMVQYIVYYLFVIILTGVTISNFRYYAKEDTPLEPISNTDELIADDDFEDEITFSDQEDEI